MKKKYNLILFFMLFLFWLILSPQINLESLIVGIAASLLITFFSKDITFENREIPHNTFDNMMKYFKFVGILLVEIVKSNINVAMIVLNPKLPVSPSFVRVQSNLKNDLLRVVYGNAVTLTPGTLTVEIEENGEFIVHALTKEAASDLKGSTMEDCCIVIDDNF